MEFQLINVQQPASILLTLYVSTLTAGRSSIHYNEYKTLIKRITKKVEYFKDKSCKKVESQVSNYNIYGRVLYKYEK